LFSRTKNAEKAQSRTTLDMIYSFEAFYRADTCYFILSPSIVVYTGIPAVLGPCLPLDTQADFLAD
jgi:hypothetical protein